MWSNTDVKPGNLFWENAQRPEFGLIFGPKITQKSGLRHPLNTCNEHVKHADVQPGKPFL